LDVGKGKIEKQKTKEGKAVSTNPKFEGWSSTLASTSESVVKAEQSEKKPFDQMQKESIEVLKKKDQESNKGEGILQPFGGAG